MAGHVALLDRRFYKTIKFAPQGHPLVLFIYLSFDPFLLSSSLFRFVYHAHRDFNLSSEIFGMLS